MYCGSRWMWTRLAHIHRHAFRTTATSHRCRRRALLDTTTAASISRRPSGMSTMSLSTASRPSQLPSQLTAMCMSHTHFQAFQGNPLNKLHLHRKDEQHIQSLQSHPAARFLVLNPRLQPLLRTLPALPATASSSASPTASLASIRTPLSKRAVITWLTAEQVSSVLSQSPIVVLLGQVDNEAPIAATVTAAGELVETGTQSDGAANDGSLEENVPYHAVLLQSEAQSSHIIAALPSTADSSYAHHDLRLSLPSLNYTDASILAQARALLEWHQSSLFCGKCGSPTQSLEGGAKRQCTAPPPPKRSTTATTAPAATTATAATAATTYCGRTLYPRTDCVTITLTVSNDGRRVLLGRKKEFPAGVYTCLAGFLEGGETPEEGARREVWEESGVCVSAVKYFASQPWPFLGGQLMIGCFAQVDPSIMQNKTKPRQPHSSDAQQHDSPDKEPTQHSLTVEEAEHIQLLDGELESVRWFTREQVGAMLTASREHPDAWSRPDAFAVGEMRVPPCYAIAHQLIAHWYLFGAEVMKEEDGAASEVEALLARGRRYGQMQGRYIAHL